MGFRTPTIRIHSGWFDRMGLVAMRRSSLDTSGLGWAVRWRRITWVRAATVVSGGCGRRRVGADSAAA